MWTYSCQDMLKKLTQYNHSIRRKTYTPYDPGPIRYGKAVKPPPPPPAKSKALNDKEKRQVQQVVGSVFILRTRRYHHNFNGTE